MTFRKKLQDYLTLCKPKVVLLMMLTSWVGMYLAPRAPFINIYQVVFIASLGIAFIASSAAICNHLIDRNIDSLMLRTKKRPMVSGTVTVNEALLLAVSLGSIGFCFLYFFINAKTAYLTLLSLFGYAFVYTIYLKRATPQNIVIGGLSGAMPPLLGWVAVSNNISPYSWLLVLIIYTWTPPHFWALAIYRAEDYAKAKIPMLPVTHGIQFTKLSLLLYTVLLILVTMLPFVTHMSGWYYLSVATILNFMFLKHVFALYLAEDAKTHIRAIKTFKFSITYLLVLFIGLVIDKMLI